MSLVTDVEPEPVERSAQRWLRAYPPRYRRIRGAEIIGLLADLIPPGSRGIGARAAADLVRGGLMTRLRTRPPLVPWLLYRLVDRRLPGHREWVRDDVEGALGPLRRMSIVLVFLVVAMAQAAPVGLAVFFAGMLALGWSNQRSQARERHLVPRPGEAAFPGAYRHVAMARRRLRAKAALPWIVGATATCAVVGLTSVLAAPNGSWVRPLTGGGHGPGFEVGYGPVVERWPAVAVALAGALLGCVAAVCVRRRLIRLSATAPAGRELVGMQPTTVMRLLIGTLVVCAVPWAELRGGLPLVLGVGLAAGAVLLLPGLLVSWPIIRAAPETVALVDSWQLATRGRTYPDPPARRLVPIPDDELDANPVPSSPPHPVSG